MDKNLVFPGAVYAAGALTNGSPCARWVKKFMKCNSEVIFSGTGATVGSIASGSLYLVLVGANNQSLDFDYAARVRFIDG